MPQRIVTIEELRGLTGREFAVSDWFEVTQDAINRFAGLTEDRQWIHLDAERAEKELPWKSTIAHGFLTLSMLTHLADASFQIKDDFQRAINYGFNRVRLPAPVPAGARIRAHFSVGAVEDVKDGIQLVWNVLVEVEGNEKPALVAEWIARLY
ncbi:MAG: MaoC family dehydratase [bacterium]|nr:MaoC family dehydratase [bacterium]